MADQNEDRGDDFTPTAEDIAEDAARVATEAAENARIAKGEDAKDPLKAGEEGSDEARAAAEAKKVADEAAKKAEEEKAAKRPEPAIPLNRHKEILQRERDARAAAEQRLADASRAGTKSQFEADIEKDEQKVEDLETKYSKALADGDVADAGKLMKEIRLLERSISARQSDAKIVAATAEATENIRFESTVAQLEAAYPELEYGNDKYDQAKVDEVLLLKTALVAQRFSPSAALQKAVAYVFPPKTVAQEKALEEVEVREDEKDLTPEEVRAKRKAEAVAKALATNNRQPSNLKDVGLDSDKNGGTPKKSVLKMSQSDFDKLGEEELAAMRGDAL